MSALHLHVRARPAQPIDVSGLLPLYRTNGDLDTLGAQEVPCGSRLRRLSELFELELKPDEPESVEFHGACESVNGIGAALVAGRVVVHGNAGAFLGQDMAGGQIEVHGSCEAYAGTGMKGGSLRIAGNAGDYLGAARAGERQGLQGGTIVVCGDAQARVGERMRAGLIVILGRAGASCAARMIAGTIVIGAATGPGVGRGMRRGTVLVGEKPEAIPGTFVDAGPQAPGFLALLARELSELSGPETLALPSAPRRWLGDRANGGMGEIFTPD